MGFILSDKGIIDWKNLQSIYTTEKHSTAIQCHSEHGEVNLLALVGDRKSLIDMQRRIL